MTTGCRFGAGSIGISTAMSLMPPACPARSGAATEAQQAGASLADIAEHAQHTNINTTRKHYIVPSVETPRRIARQRVAHRQAKVNTTIWWSELVCRA
jgi:hypothetical protein